jgi:pimeloyl-ACP methyl ester carboxylesterase
MLKMDEAAETALAARKFDDAAATELQLWVAGPKRSLDAIDGALVARVREMLMKSYETPMEARAERPLAPPAVGRLDEIGAPTLVLWGELDVADILTIGETLAKGIGGARQAVISGAAHLPNMERPGEFNRILGGFLSDLG